MSQYRLDLGPLDLVNADGQNDDYWFETLADGFSLGSPEAVIAVAASLMRDGDDERIDRYGNRQVTFTVAVRGPDLAALSSGETALSLQVGRRNTLSITPPDGYGATTVFDVVTSAMDPLHDDLAEIREGVKERRYTVTLRCEPFGRSATAVTQSLAPTSTVTVTVLDPATSLTEWSPGPPVTHPSTLALETHKGESVVRATHAYTGPHEDHTTLVTWTGSPPSDPYVFFDVSWDGDGVPFQRDVTMGGAAAGKYASDYRAPIATEAVTHGTGNYTRYWFNNPGATAAADGLWLRVVRSWPNVSGQIPSDPVPLRIAQLASSDATGGGGIQTVQAVGSVRAPGSVTATRATAMSRLFLYSDPQMLTTGYSPAVQSSWAVAPAGTYVIYVASWGVAGDALSVTVTDAAGRASTASTRLKASPPHFRPIGEVRLGGNRSGALGALTFTASRNGTTETLTMANVRLFRKEEGVTALTYLDGISATSVELATPSADLPRGGLWAGDWSAFDKAVARAYPVIVPPMTALFVEADGSEPAATTLDYFPRYHTWAAS